MTDITIQHQGKDVILLKEAFFEDEDSDNFANNIIYEKTAKIDILEINTSNNPAKKISACPLLAGGLRWLEKTVAYICYRLSGEMS